MRDYFIRRMLLIPPTLFGISILVFAITRLAPGGPLEQAMMQMQQVSQDGSGGQGMGSDQALSQEQLEQMKRLYGFDKPHWEAYLIWLGVMPRETELRAGKGDKNSSHGSRGALKRRQSTLNRRSGDASAGVR